MKKYLRFLFIIIFSVALLASVLTLAACHNVTPPEINPDSGEGHVHNYSVTEVEATCTHNGVTIFSCSCGDVYTTSTPALGHDWTWKSENGKHWSYCTRCEYTTEPQEHSFENIVATTQPTCHSEGHNIFRCICGERKEVPLPMTSHDFVICKNDSSHWEECKECHTVRSGSIKAHTFEIVDSVPSTCTTNGKIVRQCTCGQSKTDVLPLSEHQYTQFRYSEDEHWTVCSECGKEQDGSKTQHAWVSEETEATCTQPGLILQKCTCGKTAQQSIPALGHDLDKSTIEKKTDSGHFYKCTRCGETAMEQHVLVDADCPDGDNKQPTCGAAGHQDKLCTVCGHTMHTKIPATGEHHYSEGTDYQSNGVNHWHYCLTCGARADEEPHIWQWQTTQEPDCTKSGIEQQVCICGHTGQSRTKAALGHDYQEVEGSSKEPSCTEEGVVTRRCTRCNDESTEYLPQLKHDWGKEWFSDESGHWHKCTLCQADQTSKGNHNFGKENVVQEATCTDDGYKESTCTACGFVHREVISAHHNWASTDEGRIDPTCNSYGSHTETCEKCGEQRTVIDEWYAEHEIIEVAAKAPTETEYGWEAHYRCKNCGQLFKTHTDEKPITQEDVYLPPTGGIVLGSIAELNELAAGYKERPSAEWYIITATLYDKIADDGTVMLVDEHDEPVMFEIDISRYDISHIDIGDQLTVKGHLFAADADATLKDAQILAVDDGDDRTSTLDIRVSGTYTRWYMMISSGNEFIQYYDLNSKQVYFNSINVGDSLTLQFYNLNSSSSVGVRSLIINGESYTLQNGEVRVEVTGDIVCEFDLSEYRELQAAVTKEDLDLPFGSSMQKVNGYLQYQVSNNSAQNGNLSSGSHLIFAVKNAYITRIVMEFEEDENTDLTMVAKNTLYIGTDKDHKNAVSYTMTSKKVTVNISFDDHITYMDYFANAAQARISKVTIYYNTYNS